MNDTTTNDPVTNAIEKALAKCPKAKRIAVQNFVWSAPDDKTANGMNLEMDAKMYRWNGDTVKAIRLALRELGKIY
jgi:hypothetical protein